MGAEAEQQAAEFHSLDMYLACDGELQADYMR